MGVFEPLCSKASAFGEKTEMVVGCLKALESKVDVKITNLQKPANTTDEHVYGGGCGGVGDEELIGDVVENVPGFIPSPPSVCLEKGSNNMNLDSNNVQVSTSGLDRCGTVDVGVVGFTPSPPSVCLEKVSNNMNLVSNNDQVPASVVDRCGSFVVGVEQNVSIPHVMDPLMPKKKAHRTTDSRFPSCIEKQSGKRKSKGGKGRKKPDKNQV